MEPWQGQDTADSPADLRTHAGVAAVVAGLRDLGMLKVDEQPRLLHQYGCPASAPPYPDATCQCPGGPELLYPDFDEVTPTRHYIIPARFYVRH